MCRYLSRSKHCIICIIILGLELMSGANSQGGDLISVFGMDNMSCGKYVQDITSNLQASNVYGWWIAGFVTGTNVVKGRRTSTDNATHEAWLKKYCQDHPEPAWKNWTGT